MSCIRKTQRQKSRARGQKSESKGQTGKEEEKHREQGCRAFWGTQATCSPCKEKRQNQNIVIGMHHIFIAKNRH